jgi:hypothetical protein
MFLTHENAERQAAFFAKLSQFSMVNKVLDPVDPNINDSLTRATVLLPFS